MTRGANLLSEIPEQLHSHKIEGDEQNNKGMAVANWLNQNAVLLKGNWNPDIAMVELKVVKAHENLFGYVLYLFYQHWGIRVLWSVLLVVLVTAPSLSALAVLWSKYNWLCKQTFFQCFKSFSGIPLCRQQDFDRCLQEHPELDSCESTCDNVVSFLDAIHSKLHLSYVELFLPSILALVLVYCFAMEAAKGEHHSLLMKFVHGMSVSKEEKRQVQQIEHSMRKALNPMDTARIWWDYFRHGKISHQEVKDLEWKNVPYRSKESQSNQALAKVTDAQLSMVGDRFWSWKVVSQPGLELDALMLQLESEAPNEWAVWTRVKIKEAEWRGIKARIQKSIKEKRRIVVNHQVSCQKCHGEIKEPSPSGKSCSIEGCNESAKRSCKTSGCDYHLCEEHRKEACCRMCKGIMRSAHFSDKRCSVSLCKRDASLSCTMLEPSCDYHLCSEHSERLPDRALDLVSLLLTNSTIVDVEVAGANVAFPDQDAPTNTGSLEVVKNIFNITEEEWTRTAESALEKLEKVCTASCKKCNGEMKEPSPSDTRCSIELCNATAVCSCKSGCDNHLCEKHSKEVIRDEGVSKAEGEADCDFATLVLKMGHNPGDEDSDKATRTRETIERAMKHPEWKQDFNWFVVALMEDPLQRRRKKDQLTQSMLLWFAIPVLSVIFGLVAPIVRVKQDSADPFPAPFGNETFFTSVSLTFMMSLFLLIFTRVTLGMTLMAKCLDDFKQLTIDPSGQTKVPSVLETVVQDATKSTTSFIAEKGHQVARQATHGAVQLGESWAADCLEDVGGEDAVTVTSGTIGKAGSSVEGVLDRSFKGSSPPAARSPEQKAPQLTEVPDKSTVNPFDLYVPATVYPYMPWEPCWREAWTAKKDNLDKWQNCQTYLRIYVSHSRLVAQAMLVAAALVLGSLLLISLTQTGEVSMPNMNIPGAPSALQHEMTTSAAAAIDRATQVVYDATGNMSVVITKKLEEAELAILEAQDAVTITSDVPLDIETAMSDLQRALSPHFAALDEPLLRQIEALQEPARRLMKLPTPSINFALSALTKLARININQFVTLAAAIIILIYTVPLIYAIACVNDNFDQHASLLQGVKSSHTDIQAKRESQLLNVKKDVGSSRDDEPGITIDTSKAEIMKFGRVVDGKFIVNSGSDEGLTLYTRSLNSAIEGSRESVKRFPLAIFGFIINFTLLGSWLFLAAGPIGTQAKQMAPKLVMQGCLAAQNLSFFKGHTTTFTLLNDTVCKPLVQAFSGGNSSTLARMHFEEHSNMITQASRHLSAGGRTAAKVRLRAMRHRRLSSAPLREAVMMWWSRQSGRPQDKLAIAKVVIGHYKRQAMRRLIQVPNAVLEACHRSGWQSGLDLAMYHLEEVLKRLPPRLARGEPMSHTGSRG